VILSENKEKFPMILLITTICSSSSSSKLRVHSILQYIRNFPLPQVTIVVVFALSIHFLLHSSVKAARKFNFLRHSFNCMNSTKQVKVILSILEAIPEIEVTLTMTSRL